MATCPECEFDEIDTTDHEEGDAMSCPECGKNLILASPDRLEVADDEDDDEDDDDDDDLDDEDEEEEEGELDEEGLFDDEDDVDDEEEEVE